MPVKSEDLDLGSSAVTADPYSYFGELRERDPVHWNTAAKVWIVTRHEDVVALVRSPERFSSEVAVQPQDEFPPLDEADWGLAERLVAEFRPFMLHDRPEHQMMRGAIHRWFTPRAVEKYREELRKELDELIDALRPQGGMELKDEFAVQLPLRTITWMLGVPDQDAGHLRELTDIIVAVGFDPDRMQRLMPAWDELRAYFDTAIEERMARPGDDLLSLFATGLRDGAYTHDQCVASAAHLLMAGHGTTLNLITNGTRLLLLHPEQWDLLKEDPVGRCATATEECLRYEPSLKLMPRVCSEDTELRGKTIRAGERALWVIACANRDPRVFSEPEKFDILRDPNPHVAFGGGIHHCLGAALARIEGQEAFRALAERLPDMQLTDDPIEYIPNMVDRELTSLRVTW